MKNRFTLNRFWIKRLLFTLFTLFLLNTGNAQVDLLVSTEATSDGNLKLDSIKTGKNFIFVIDYSISSLTSNGNNVIIKIPLPANLAVAPGATSIAYDASQITSVTNVAGLITATFRNPIPAGSTGQMQISMVYANGTTPNAYTPLIITSIEGTNANVSPKLDTSSIKALAGNNIVLNKVARNYSTNPTLNGPFTYDISYTNSGGAEGNLNLYQAKILDTLPVGVVFVSATKFGSITPTATVLGTGETVVSWDWGAATLTGTGSASITVKYTAPTFSIGSTFQNCASLTGNIPVLPFTAGTAALAAAPEVRACASGTLIASTSGISNPGAGTTSQIPGLCPGVVMAGSNANFKTGWTNSGNTNLDFVEIITSIDPNIDVTSVFAKKVSNPVPGSPVPQVKVYQYYELNNSGVWTAVSGSPFDNTTMANSYPVTLGPGDFISKVKIRVEPDVDAIGPYFTQDLTYTGSIRTTTSNGGGTIIQGSNNPGTCAVTLLGTQVNNCYQLNASANSAALPLSNACGNARIIGQAPVFSSLDKTTTNGTSFGPTDVITYVLSAKQLGIGVAQNVSFTDVLNSKLEYQAGSAQFKLNAGAYAPLASVGVSGQTITFPIADVASGDQIFVKFDAKVKDGTAPSTIGNFATLASSNSYINAGNPNTNTKNITVVSAAAYTSKLGQSGCDTTQFVYYPDNAHATPQGKIKYRALLRNTGNVGANNITMIDVFPFIGDVRGSQYFANLAAPITFTDPSTTIYYDTVSNPCMPEFSPAINPAGCNTANWSVTPPADITSVKAIKITRSATIAPLDSLVYTWPMILPVGVPSNIVMYNSYTYQLNRTDNSAQLLPATPNKVGMVTDCISALGSLGNYAWVDSNANGLQDESVLAGINGLKVYLYKPGPSNLVGGNDQILLDSTFTANDFTGRKGYYTFTNLATGDYYVKFPTIAGKVFTKLDQTIKTDNNSNANRSTGYSELVRIDVALGGLDKDNPTIDAGYIVCTLNVVAQKTDISCNNWGDGKIDLTVTGNRGPATYLWSDGPTIKDRVFLVAGNYSVQVTDSVGCVKSSASQTIVNPIVLPSITGTNTICVDSTTTLQHAIPGGVWSINNTSIATINSSTGLLTGVGAGTGIVTYKINNGACGTAYFYPNVQICGPGGGVGGGGGGGLESKSLGDAVAKRIFNNAINSLQGPVEYSKLAEWRKTGSRYQIAGVGTKLQLSDILPQKLSSSVFAASVTTPLDILAITNAKEVMAVDFTSNNKAKAVAFATKTLGEVYDHTKSICDRLKGSELIGIQNIVIDSISLVRYDLKNNLGVNEYAISFIVGAKTGRNNYTIQSTWLNKDYMTDEVLYNVQLWAVNTGLLMDMANDVISRLKASMPLNMISSKATLPKTYITIGKREGTNLNLAITNAQTASSGYFEISEKANEQGVAVKRKVPFTVNANGKSNISLPVRDNYEASIDLYLNNKLEDQVFMADGTWGYDYNKATTTVKDFKISNDANINAANPDNFLLFRNMTIAATSPDYVSVYKVLRGGGAAQNLTDYKTFQFTAGGEGTNLRITLVRNGIANWADQYSYTLPITKEAKEYKISLSDFKSAVSKDKLDASDLTMATFSFEIPNAKSTSFNGSISSAAFTKEDIAYTLSLQSRDISVFPNPTNGRFTATFKSDKAADLTLRVTNSSTGKLVFSKLVSAIKGENRVQVDIANISQMNICVLTLEGANIKYEPKKVIIAKQ